MTLTVPVAIAPQCPPETPDEPSREALLAAYAEVCLSYHAIDDFRTKLLGILPISSLAGILLLGKDSLFAGNNSSALQLVGFGSFFAAAFTLGLFLFEIRGILRCHHLIERGEELERELKVRGQFFVCKQQHGRDSSVERIFNAKVAASAIYSLVFSAWLFMALKFSFGVTIVGCGLTATILGGALAVGTFNLLSRRIAA
ncbi:MAG: hypothetical protein ACJ8GN_04000 [Longimicrobiaceae bacterium]